MPAEKGGAQGCDKVSCMNTLKQLNDVLLFLRRIRNTNRRWRLLDHPLLRTYLRYVQRALGDVLQCRTAFGGSLALFLLGKTNRFGDFDIVTDRLLSPEDLPWEVDRQSRVGLQIHDYSLDIMFNNANNNAPIMEVANDNIVETSDGIRVQSENYVLTINRLWDREGAKRRMLIDETAIDPEFSKLIYDAWLA